ncbi:glycosyltransferase family 4 protein [Mucilaginibacter aquaedulcis]|uniref:glycosyltransferase family 4 protein n=1 Tax=Mucilaginibacter aquaedulcis TaxID=1187081 RepID=UPI0025B521DC|nr:glycosyltransferase family 4 protein [Mucilaginibacter aquaedulcis]MDN3547625.1 glycosyltransferase family 4 protein [Mucilaginibacter aquaedulcis]
MKVAFIVRPNLYTIAGGDTVQIDQTAKQLRILGVEVDILLSNAEIAYNRYDLLNFFHITRPAAIINHCQLSNLPFVVSTIFCAYGDYYKYNQTGINLLFSKMSEDTKDYFRNVLRWLRGRERLPVSYLWKGQRKSIIKVLKTTDMVLPNSQSELDRLAKDYASSARHAIITNGINPNRFPFNSAIAKDEKLIISVGRIEKRKNQLNLIKAVNNSDYKLVLIGAPSPNQSKYYQQCIDHAGPNVSFLNRLPHDEMVKYYQLAKIHVLASWFETTGLSSLEAAIMRCNIVITDKGDTSDYFANDAFYCDPASPESIRAAIDQASKVSFNEALIDRILTQHTWKKAAEQTLQAYNLLLASKKQL